MLTEIKITVEMLTKLRELYPQMATYGDSVLVTYALERHTNSLQQHTVQLPHFVGATRC